MPRYLAMLALAAATFAVGIVVGQGGLPAKAQAPSVEEKAAAIKAHLLEKITAVNAEVPPERWRHINGTHTTYEQYRAEYLYRLAYAAKDDAVLGHYLRYMAPALRYFFISEDTLLGERFVDYFAQQMAATGVPPVVPNFTDEDFKRLAPSAMTFEDFKSLLPWPGTMFYPKVSNWPYSAGGAAVFGEW
ncbi:MAG: hypothetical protein ACM3US_00035 [Sphingomonadaceae bacterium]